jgi:molecular chaperone DnaK (HSP70)
LIPKNSPLPAVGRHVFRTARVGQRNCCIDICDGESDDPEYCTPIGRVVVDGLHEAGPKRWYVKVKLICQEDGQLSVTSTIHDPDQPQQVVRVVTASIEPAHGMSADQVQLAREMVDSLEVI